MYINRDKFVNFRLSHEEKQSLKIMAGLEHRSQSEMMRALIREGLKIRGIDIVDRRAILEASKNFTNQESQGDHSIVMEGA